MKKKKKGGKGVITVVRGGKRFLNSRHGLKMEGGTLWGKRGGRGNGLSEERKGGLL